MHFTGAFHGRGRLEFGKPTKYWATRLINPQVFALFPCIRFVATDHALRRSRLILCHESKISWLTDISRLQVDPNTPIAVAARPLGSCIDSMDYVEVLFEASKKVVGRDVTREVHRQM